MIGSERRPQSAPFPAAREVILVANGNASRVGGAAGAERVARALSAGDGTLHSAVNLRSSS